MYPRTRSGWGGKPSDWSSSPPNLSTTAQQQTCRTPNCAVDPVFNPYGLPQSALHLPRDLNCSKTQPCCYVQNDMKPERVSTPADCCALCQKTLGCVGWVFNAKIAGSKSNCFPKSAMEKKDQQCRDGCTSGGALSPPAPPSPSPPPPPPPNSTMLFNVIDDPTEHNEVSAANPEIVARLKTVLDQFRVTANTAVDPLNCGPQKGKVTPQGTVVTPWCTVGSKDV